MGRAVFTIGFSPNSPPERVEEVIDKIRETFAENGYEVLVDPPQMCVENIEAKDFERILGECLETLGADGIVGMGQDVMQAIMQGKIPGELFEAMGLSSLDPNEVHPKWRLPKGFY